jgi:hypothetical protein
MMSLTLIPIILIPASALLCIVFNCRWKPVIKLLEQSKTDQRDIYGCTNLDYKIRLQSLRYSIAFQYVAILFFVISAVSMLLAAVWMQFIFLSIICILIGCILMFLGVCHAIREICGKSKIILDTEE